MFGIVFQFPHIQSDAVHEHDMDQEEGPEQSIRVENMIIHPKWNKNCVSCGYVKKQQHLTINRQ